EEDFGFAQTYSEHEAQSSQTQLEMMENELAGKQQEIEDLSRELEQMRAACGTEGLQQLQEFEAAVKQRDGIITQLTANLQQARKEKDDIMREFLELTEQSQKLKIRFQQVKKTKTKTNTTLLAFVAVQSLTQAALQCFTYAGQQLGAKEMLNTNCLKKKKKSTEEQWLSLSSEKFKKKKKKNESEKEGFNGRVIKEKDELIEFLKEKLKEQENTESHLNEQKMNLEKFLAEVKEQLSQRDQETETLQLELKNSKQRERQSSDEIKQLMGTVEALQKRYHKGSQSETEIVQKKELEMQRKLEQLRAELDEMYGQQIVQMKLELQQHHTLEIDRLSAQHKAELEKTSSRPVSNVTNEEQIHLMNMAINELNVKLQDTSLEKDQVKQEMSRQLEKLLKEKSALESRIENLIQDLNFAREQLHRTRQNLTDQEHKLGEVDELQLTIEDLKSQLAAMSEATKELESKHEAEVTNYKIKLEMLEKEKDAVLDRMAESQEAELERLRTQLLFSNEEELTKLKEDLEKQHKLNIENLRDDLAIKHKQQLETVQKDLNLKLEALNCERESLVTEKNQLISEISKLKEELQQSKENSKTEEMILQINELQMEVEALRKEEKEKGTLEQEIQELHVRTELLEKQTKEKEDEMKKKVEELEKEKNVLEEKLETYVSVRENESSLLVRADVGRLAMDPNLQKRIEALSIENEKLKKQEIELKEEIERQRNTFSFAERNFEVNFQELQDELACLMKAKAELEEEKSIREAEYAAKLKALDEEPHHLEMSKGSLSGLTVTVFEACKESKAELMEAFESEVVEKDTTELMEKLEIAQREKNELSLRLSDISEQLELRQLEIIQLQQELGSVKAEKEQMLLKCKELELIISKREIDIGQDGETDSSDAVAGCIDSYTESSTHKESEQQIKLLQEKLISLEMSLQNVTLERNQLQLQQLKDRSVTEPSTVATAQTEKELLQQQLDALKTEQNELRLQMEAQRICLTQVYSAQLVLVREHLETEKEHALSCLKRELTTAHTQEVKQLQQMHQQELQDLKGQRTDGETRSSQAFIKKLSKVVSEECLQLIKSFSTILGEEFMTTLKSEELPNVIGTDEEQNTELQLHTSEAKALLTSLQMLEQNILGECNRLTALQTQLENEYNKKTLSVLFLFGFFNCVTDLKEQLKVRSARLEEIEKLKMEFSQQRKELEDQHSQEIERLRSYYQEQSKETEERYKTEIFHLQHSLEEATKS
uniref:A-kinase anchoring protein 9 n=1 Tax=Latimeria chalumnae TaxID=7897 RepID=H3AHT1_LATCH